MKTGGLDIGTTGCKITVFDENGRDLGRSYLEYPREEPNNIHEVDLLIILDCVITVLKDITKRFPDIAGIGVTSFGETFVMTDGLGIPLHRAMLYTDPRGSEECKELSSCLSEETIISITGTKPQEMFSLPKMMWIKKNQPKIYQRAAHFFLIEDFIIYHLTGKCVIDYSLATRTMGFDIHTCTFSKTMFDAAGIDMERMSMPVPTGTLAGKVTEEVSKMTGLSPETKIVAISHDQVAAAVGAGAFNHGIAVDGAGTVECITPVFEQLPDMGVMSKGNYAVVPYILPGSFVCYAFSYTGGALLQWCIDTFAKKEKELAKAAGMSVNSFLEQQYQGQHGEEPSNLLVLPYFAGAATPFMDIWAKGAILGLTTAATLSEIYHACMEGIAYEMALNMEYLGKESQQIKLFHATGGGARSRIFMQMKADVLGIPFTALETVDAGTIGSAMLTGIALGQYDSLEEAGKIMVKKQKTFYPREEMHEKYQKQYQQYKKIYPAVKEII